MKRIDPDYVEAPVSMIMNAKALTWVAVAAIATASATTTYAGDREWATAGKILTGVAVGSVLTRAFCSEPAVVYTAPPATVVYTTPPPTPTVVYTPPPATVVTYAAPVVAPAPATVVYAPAPVVYAPAPVVVYPRPCYYPPLVSVRVGFGGHYHRGPHHRW